MSGEEIYLAEPMDSKGKFSTNGQTRAYDGIRVLQEAIARNNFEKGWRNRTPVGETKRPISEHVALLHSEVTEIFDAYRNNEPEIWYEYTLPDGKKTDWNHRDANNPLSASAIGDAPFLGKPQGMVSELADVVIRALDFADEHEFNLAEILLQKHAYNLTRSYRHGGKQA